jgi:hypothetical protein
VAAPVGNQFWLARSSHGAKPKFECAEELWAACVEYFDWVQENPLYEDKLVTFQGVATHEPVAKMRAMTIAGLCLFLDIGRSTWGDYKGREDFSEVVSRAEQIIYEQKFTGAAADLLNPNIIARELGLADRSELTGKDGGPIQSENKTTLDVSGLDTAQLEALASIRVPTDSG